MNDRREFLETLRAQLSGQMHEGKIAAHVRYYEDYIQSQVRNGRREEEVLAELGDPRLIAKTLLDTDPESGEEIYEESRSSYNTNDNQRTTVKSHKLDLTTWYGKLIVIAAAAVVIFLLVTILTAVAPFFIVLALVLFVISRFRKR